MRACLGVVVTLLAPCVVRANDAAELEAWLGKSGKVVRDAKGQVEEVAFYGDRAIAAGRDKTIEPRRFKDADLARLAGCTELRHLDLDGFMDMDGTGFAKLGGLKKLAVLSTQNPAFSEDGLAAIGTVRSLRSVSLGHTRTNLTGAVKMLDGLKDLEEFAPGVVTNDILLEAASRCPRLKKLTFPGHWDPIGDKSLTFAGYQHLLKLPELTELAIEVYPDDAHPKPTIEIVGKLKKLKKLTLTFATRTKGRCVVSKEDLEPLAKLPSLETVRLVGDGTTYKIEPGALTAFRDCPNLNWLFVHHTTVPEAEFLALKQAKPKLHLQSIENMLKPKIVSW